MPANEPFGFNKMTCNFCGVNNPVFISIMIATDDGSEYPYTQTDMCKSCWQEFGINAAFEHNSEIKEIRQC